MGKLQKIKALWNDRDNQSSYWKWLVSYSKPFTPKLILLVILNSVGALFSLVFAIISKNIIDNATGGNKLGITQQIALYVGVLILSEVIGIVSQIVTVYVSERYTFVMRNEMFGRILSSKWLEVKRYHTGDVVSRIMGDVSNIEDGVINTIPSIISLTIEVIFVFITLFYYSPMLAILALVVAPVAAIGSVVIGKKMKYLQMRVRQSEAEYNSFVQESMSNLLVVKTFTHEESSVARLNELRKNRFYWIMKRTKITILNSLLMSATFSIGYVFALSYGAVQIADGVITYGTMSVFLTLVNQIQSPILMLVRKIPHVVSVLASAGRIKEMHEIGLEKRLDTEFDSDENQSNVGVKITNIEFGYDDDLVLDNLNLDIKPGETVAIVGESGIGKTTLVRLIMSLVEGSKGKIEFYNADGSKGDASASSRRFMSYVPQGNTLFSGTIRENILMGNKNATDEEIAEVLDLVAATEFVDKLPNKVDTVIGERGHGLSEGQAQRIAIARALIKKAPFLILDEATSALDEQTEMRVIEGIRKQSPKPTCLVITHRKGILRFCDRELRIENRNISEN